MEFIRNHKNICSLIIIIILAIIAIFYTKTILNSTEKEAIYGTRTAVIDDVKITNNKEDQIVDIFSDISNKATVEEQGRIVEVIVTLKDNIKPDTAKDKAKDIMKVLSNKERKVYDVQVFFTKTTKDEKYPIIGYLHHGKDRFSWTKDR